MFKKFYKLINVHFVDKRPKPWGMFHLLFILGVLVVAAIFTIIIWKSKSKQKSAFWLLMSVWILLFLLECLKQFYAGSEIDSDGNWKWHYKERAKWVVPLALCSLPIYFISLHLMTIKFKKFNYAILSFVTIYTLYGGAFVLLMLPNQVLNDSKFLSSHLLILMLSVGIALVFNKVIKFSWKTIGLSFLCIHMHLNFCRNRKWNYLSAWI